MRTAATALGLALLGMACNGGDVAVGPPECRAEEVAFPAWMPDDLPLPEGTGTVRDRGQSDGFFRATFLAPVDATQLGDFLLERFPAAGYELGRGHAAADRIEVDFSKQRRGGILIASQPCEDDESLVELLFTRDAQRLPPVDDRGSPFNPRAP
jgi:hypothetical protein